MSSDWWIYALGSAVFAGLTAVLAKVGVSGLPSNTATLIRTIVIILFLGERLNLMQWGGVLLMSVGALLVAFK